VLPPVEWVWALDRFLATFAASGSAPRTWEAYRVKVTRFLLFLADSGVIDVSGIVPGTVMAFTATLRLAPTVRASCLYTLRAFLRFLTDEHDGAAALADLFPTILVNKDAVLPSVFTALEIRRVVGAADAGQSTGRRDRAIVLLAALLAMRASDVKALTLAQIDWAGKKVSFPQVKTGNRVDLPLPDECFASQR